MSSNSTVTAIDMSVLPASTPSLCIPRVFVNITKERIAFVIRELGLGEIDHIDMIPRESDNGEKFQRVFIHFKRWGESESAKRARERVLGGKEIKIIYDDPWYWKLSANRSVARPMQNGADSKQNRQRPRPRLVDEESSDGDFVQKKQREPSPMSQGRAGLEEGEWSTKKPKKIKRVIVTDVNTV